METLQMAGTRGILAALAIGSAIISLPAGAQSGSSASLTHTVSATVPPRVKVQVSNFSVPTPGVVRNVSQAKTDGLTLTINASRAWVLTAGSAIDTPTSKSSHRWSSDSSSGLSTVFIKRSAVANTNGGPVVLTVAAP
jgi:hypothetical protein